MSSTNFISVVKLLSAKIFDAKKIPKDTVSNHEGFIGHLATNSLTHTKTNLC